MNELKKQGKTIFFSTHILPDIEMVCDRVAILISGRLAVVDGDITWGSVMMGQSAGLVKKEQSTEEIIVELFSEAEKVLKSLFKKFP